MVSTSANENTSSKERMVAITNTINRTHHNNAKQKNNNNSLGIVLINSNSSARLSNYTNTNEVGSHSSTAGGVGGIRHYRGNINDPAGADHGNDSGGGGGFFEGCDLWEQRGFFSIVAMFCVYAVFICIQSAFIGATHEDHSVIEWGSCLVSFLISLLCIFQAVNTFRSFRYTSGELTFLFVSIFSILAFFLLLRSVLVFPYVQRGLGESLTVACIGNCDAISMAILLLRVPKQK